MVVAPLSAPDDRRPASAATDRPYADRRQELRELLAILGDALSFFPPLYVNSILGHPWTWLPPHPKTSEYSVVNPRQLAKSLDYLVHVTVPAAPISLPQNLPGFGDAVFWRPTEVQYQLDPNNIPDSFPEESWVFINGVATNSTMARINSSYLAEMFRRPMTVIQNASDSIGVDLMECVVGKAWEALSEPTAKAYPFIHHALENPYKQRVVVICHSQGTIIMSNVLRALINDAYRQELNDAVRRLKIFADGVELQPLNEPGSLRKLEVYALANCASVMAYAPDLLTDKGSRVPWIESFGNEYDLVARCGMLAPNGSEHGIRIDGARYVNRGMWGHVLNVHYLWGIHDHLKDPGRYPNPYYPMGTGPSRSRLYDYFDGGVPDLY